ncbi:MAG: hypothetical protein DRG78_00370 [Epsilonproteobacteria bacterium]|nr:MAG: hypothetical protein DRG78_00370 [Campylobacterota bacterium]
MNDELIESVFSILFKARGKITGENIDDCYSIARTHVLARELATFYINKKLLDDIPVVTTAYSGETTIVLTDQTTTTLKQLKLTFT